jgi:Flp pilus assembly protein protease CpaA
VNPRETRRVAEPAAAGWPPDLHLSAYFGLPFFQTSAAAAMITLQPLTANQGVGPTAVFTNQQTRWWAALALPLVAGPSWCLAWRGHIGWPGTLAGFVLLSAVLTSAVTDFRNHRIYNWVTYTAFLWAIAINIAASILSSDATSRASMFFAARLVGPEWLGGVGIRQSLAGAALCFVVVLAAYHLSGGGAGDVKLATVIGALVGVRYGIFAVGYSYIIAAIAMTAWTVYRGGPLTLAKAMFITISNWIGLRLERMGIGWPFPPREADVKVLFKPVPLGPFFAIGTLLVVFQLVPL